MKFGNNFRVYWFLMLCMVRREFLGAAVGSLWNVEHIVPYDFVRYVVDELMVIWHDVQMMQQIPISEKNLFGVSVESVINHIIDANKVVCTYYDKVLMRSSVCAEKIEYILAIIHKIKLAYAHKKKELTVVHKGYSVIEEYLVMLENNLFDMLDACCEY